ncbi:MAG: RNA 2',3'-cyclic phosphodiesterase [Puniceicoccales bacterium]
MQRLFVALDLPDYTREALGQLEEEMRGVSWSLSENRHLTLFFLGETEPPRIEMVQHVLRNIQVASFFMPIQDIGYFPPKGQPRVLWAGVGNGHPHLFQLQHRITDALFGIGFDPGERAWQPHITLARCGGASEESIRQYMKKHRDFESAPVRVTEFHLFASERQGGRRFYPLVETFPLTDV